MTVIGELIVLVVRGVLLWIVLPIGVAVWIFTYPFATLLDHGVQLPRALGWADLNLVASLERCLPKQMLDARTSFVPWRDVSGVSHRVHLSDIM